jgi:hypothetical protein
MRFTGDQLKDWLSRSFSPYCRGLTSDDAGTPSSCQAVTLPGCYFAFFAFLSTFSFALFDMVDTRSNALFEYPCIASQLTRSAAIFE